MSLNRPHAFTIDLDLELELEPIPPKNYNRALTAGVKPAQPYLVIYGRKFHIHPEHVDGLIYALQEMKRKLS
jgi:hypothetical protein